MASNARTMPDVDEEDDALLVATEVHDRNLSRAEEQALFDVAKEDALKPWILNHAWEPADSSSAQPEEAVPARLEWAKACWHLMLFPNADPQSDELARMFGSFVVTDAKSLYYAANSMSAGLKLSERRSAIELSGTNERLKAMGGHWKWCNSSQQLADGLTKASARALCLEAFARGMVSLKFDEGMVAAKKIKPEAKQAEVEELEQAARQLRDGQVPAAPRRLRGEGEGEETLALELSVRCRLQGCDKEVPHPELGQRFCSRRHYYKSLGGDTERARAIVAATVLASQFESAEGLGDSDEVTVVLVVDHRWFAAILALLVMVFMIVLWLCVARRTTWTFSATSSTTASSTSSSNQATSSTRDAQVQARDMTNPEAERLRDELIRRNGECHRLGLVGDRVRAEAERLRASLSESNNRVLELEQQLRDLQNQVVLQENPRELFVTATGHRYHLNSNCGHIRGHRTIKRLTPCDDCSR